MISTAACFLGVYGDFISFIQFYHGIYIFADISRDPYSYFFPCVWFAVSYVTVCICLYLCVAIDIDAVGLESEEPEPPPPPQQRSPKASPNQVISTLTREKRMPFFKKVTREASHSVYRTPSYSCMSLQHHAVCIHLSVHATSLYV